MTEKTRFWLMKSEPNAYSIDNLKNEGTTLWDGIRNYQARNFMREMQIGDQVFFYHSNCKPPGIIGLMEVIETNLIDPTQFDRKSNYFDQKSKKENPRWDCVKVKYLKKFEELLSLKDINESFKESELLLIRKGNRLSIMPIMTNIAMELLSKLNEIKSSK